MCRVEWQARFLEGGAAVRPPRYSTKGQAHANPLEAIYSSATMYEIEFSDQAGEDLQWFKKREQNEIVDGIESHLRFEPTVETRNRKRLRPNQISEWELRIGKFRVFYNADELVKIVSIERIGLKLIEKFLFRGREEEL